MKGMRDGVDKEKLLKEAKANAELVDFVKSITKEEVERLVESRKFDNIEPGTLTYKIALYLDSLRRDLREKKMTIYKRLWNIRNVNNTSLRLNEQLKSGKITEILKDGVTMNAFEVTTELKHQEWLAVGEAEVIPQTLAEIRGLVGHFDVVKQVIMTEEQFDEYAGGILKELKELGYEVLN